MELTTAIQTGGEAHVTTTEDNNNSTERATTANITGDGAAAAAAPPSKNGSPLSEYTRKEYAFMISAGVLLAFNAGFVNGACLSGLLTTSQTEQSVAGFTAMYSDTALEILDGNERTTGYLLSIVLSFMWGAFIAGLLTPQAQPYRIFPTYAPTFFIGGIFLAIGSVMAALELGGDRCFYFVAAANGIQNGISSQYSANLIRSTNSTGPTVDAALFFGQFLRGNKAKLWRLKVLVSLIMSFWTGGLASYYATDRYTHHTLLFNAGLFVILGMALVVFVVKNLDVSVTDALFGTWQWKKALNKLDIMQGDSVDEARALEVFDRLDIDGSGQIDAKELFLALEAVGVKGLTMATVKMMISIVDDDGNEQISREEWLHLVKRDKNKK